MFQAFIVAFREILEITLVVGVVLAATRGVPKRGHWIGLGIFLGVMGSALVAAFTESISQFAEGMGQELFNAVVMLTVSLMIGWTAIWMRSHARKMVAGIREKSGKIIEGELPKITLAAIIALAVLRDGAEIVLFTYGLLASGESFMSVMGGALGGVATGILIGFLLYAGLLSIPTKYIFQVTTWLLLLLAAGMASLGAKFLVSAGYFSSLSATVWNSSALLSENSIAGKIFQALFGYSEQPMEIQLIFYVAVLAGFAAMMRVFSPKKAGSSK